MTYNKFQKLNSNSFLEKLKLKQFFTIKIEIEKNEFVENLKKHIDKGEIGVFSMVLDGFSSSKKTYQGEVNHQGFTIRRRKLVFDVGVNLAISKGTFKQVGDTLNIETEINGYRGMLIPFYILLLMACGFYILKGTLFLDIGSAFVLPLTFFTVFIFVPPYFVMRKSIKRMKYELERDLYFFTKK